MKFFDGKDNVFLLLARKKLYVDVVVSDIKNQLAMCNFIIFLKKRMKIQVMTGRYEV